MKKLFAGIAAVSLLLLSGCTNYGEKFAGYADIENAGKLYTALDSAHVTVTDNTDGTVTGAYWFRYEGDMLTYLYLGNDGVNKYYEYHSGYQLSKANGGDQSWTELTNSDEGYIAYTRASTFAYSSAAFFYLDGQSISETSVTENGGEKTIIFSYDSGKLNSSAAKQLSSLGSMDAFKVTYVLDADGNVKSMTQAGTLTGTDGKQMAIDCTFAIDSENALSPIDRPLVADLDSGSGAYTFE